MVSENTASFVEMFKRPDPAPPSRVSRTAGLTCGIVSGACYGGMSFGIHYSARSLPSAEIVFLRSLTALIVLLPIILMRIEVLTSRAALMVWLRGIAGALSVLCLTWNLQHTSVGFANALYNLAPLGIVVFSTYLGNELLCAAKLIAIVLVVVASVVFWDGSGVDKHLLVWVVGILGAGAASIAYGLVRNLSGTFSSFDLAWTLSVMTLPVSLAFRKGMWIVPAGNIRLVAFVISLLPLIGMVLAYESFKRLDVSTATALIPSSIIWGVILDVTHHDYPPRQGAVGCLLYIVAMYLLAVRRGKGIMSNAASPYAS